MSRNYLFSCYSSYSLCLNFVRILMSFHSQLCFTFKYFVLNCDFMLNHRFSYFSIGYILFRILLCHYLSFFCFILSILIWFAFKYRSYYLFVFKCCRLFVLSYFYFVFSIVIVFFFYF